MFAEKEILSFKITSRFTWANCNLRCKQIHSVLSSMKSSVSLKPLNNENLVNFSLSYSLSVAALIDPLESTMNTDGKDHLHAEAVQ
jgi:hypothetical protein